MTTCMARRFWGQNPEDVFRTRVSSEKMKGGRVIYYGLTVSSKFMWKLHLSTAVLKGET